MRTKWPRLPRKALGVVLNIIKIMREILPAELAVGCGIDNGKITQVFILCEWDYLGKEVNNAAKLQQDAWDEVVVSPNFQKKLIEDNPAMAESGRKLGERSLRYDPKNITNCNQAALPNAWYHSTSHLLPPIFCISIFPTSHTPPGRL